MYARLFDTRAVFAVAVALGRRSSQVMDIRPESHLYK